MKFLHTLRPFNALLLGCCLLPGLVSPVQAAPAKRAVLLRQAQEMAEADPGCTITLQPVENGHLAGRAFSIYSIFSLSGANGSDAIRYDYVPESESVLRTLIAGKLNKTAEQITAQIAADYLSGLKSNPDGVPAAADTSAFRLFSQELRDALKQAGVQPVRNVQIPGDSSEASYSISGLSRGYYLIDETSNPKTDAASLCLVSTVAGDQTLTLKSVYPTMDKKIREDDDDIGWNDIADFEIGQTIPYRYTVTIPPIAAYETYQLIFHDVMDPAIALDSDSIELNVRQGDKKITLEKEKDYTVNQTPAQGETFSIAVPDIKRILDSRFPPEEGQPNVYGQTLEISYCGKLTEEAWKETGRPGFENKARLEYSNNPDSDGTGKTGFTPWDPVVCFTYGLNAQKVGAPYGSEETTPLAGAHFRLFRDQALQDEVILKAVSGEAGEDSGGYTAVHGDALEKGEKGVEIMTGADGAIRVFGLDQGTYYLQETQAPEGYHPPLEPIKITLQAQFPDERNSYTEGEGQTASVLKELKGSLSYSEYYDGSVKEVSSDSLQANPDTGTVSFSVMNRPGSSLPVTGANTALLCLAVGTLSAGAGLVFQLRRKKGRP